MWQLGFPSPLLAFLSICTQDFEYSYHLGTFLNLHSIPSSHDMATASCNRTTSCRTNLQVFQLMAGMAKHNYCVKMSWQYTNTISRTRKMELDPVATLNIRMRDAYFVHFRCHSIYQLPVKSMGSRMLCRSWPSKQGRAVAWPLYKTTPISHKSTQ